ncbi:MAG: glycosyltransferase family 4 protein [bacterium]
MKVLAFAYACEPHEGSEPGAGWAWARMLTGIGETWVVTRSNNREPIEAALLNVPERERLRFVYVDLPRWARFWKKGQRGVRLYYLLWQIVAVRQARRLTRRERFDLVWHLTLANVWIGSLAPLVGGIFVYGPVGGGARTPWRLLPSLGIRGVFYELFRTAISSAARYLNPLARLAWRRAALVLVQNPETRAWLPRRHRAKAVVFPNAVLEEPQRVERRRRPGPRTALFAGRLLPSKGLALAIRALELLPEWILVICGEGRDETRLRRLARRLGVDERVKLRGWVSREELQRAMREDADVLLFPSYHEQAGWAVAEALAAGLPVVCLDRGGAPVLGGIPVKTSDTKGTARALAVGVRNAHSTGVTRIPTLLNQRERLVALVDERRLTDAVGRPPAS